MTQKREDLKTGPSVAEILSQICVSEARQLQQTMLKLQGREPMRYTSWSFSNHQLETPLFGEMTVIEPDGVVTYGYKANLSGQSPEAMIISSVEDYLSNAAAYADYSGSLLGIERVGVNEQNQEIYREVVGYFNVYCGRIYNERLIAGGEEIVDEDRAAELRVILEYGLEKLGVRGKKIKKLATAALAA